MKTQLLVNIGLDIGQNKNALSVEKALSALVGWTHCTLVEHAVHASNTENTLVARIVVADLARFRLFLAAASDACQQDAVVALYESGPDAGVGFLAGPRAEAWSPFNPAYFLTLDGRTLAEENARDSALLAELGA
jgi:hypothetical protein